VRRFLKNNSLSLTLIILFVIFLIGHSIAGFKHYNEEQKTHMQPEVTYSEFVRSGEFIETVFENWESEFLQMAAYVILTIFLRQKGSAESKKLNGEEETDRHAKKTKDASAPWPVRARGVALSLYKNSLSIALILLFLLSMFLHAFGGSRATCEENIQHGQVECQNVMGYMSTSKFWYESFQNWQSEFLAVFAIVVLSIFLRQHGSPESKSVSAPHSETGS
jgi:hypothetical protein